MINRGSLRSQELEEVEVKTQNIIKDRQLFNIAKKYLIDLRDVKATINVAVNGMMSSPQLRQTLSNTRNIKFVDNSQGGYGEMNIFPIALALGGRGSKIPASRRCCASCHHCITEAGLITVGAHGERYTSWNFPNLDRGDMEQWKEIISRRGIDGARNVLTPELDKVRKLVRTDPTKGDSDSFSLPPTRNIDRDRLVFSNPRYANPMGSMLEKDKQKLKIEQKIDKVKERLTEFDAKKDEIKDKQSRLEAANQNIKDLKKLKEERGDIIRRRNEIEKNLKNNNLNAIDRKALNEELKEPKSKSEEVGEKLEKIGGEAQLKEKITSLNNSIEEGQRELLSQEGQIEGLKRQLKERKVDLAATKAEMKRQLEILEKIKADKVPDVGKGKREKRSERGEKPNEPSVTMHLQSPFRDDSKYDIPPAPLPSPNVAASSYGSSSTQSSLARQASKISRRDHGPDAASGSSTSRGS